MESQVHVSTIIDDSTDSSALVVFTNGVSCRVPYVQKVPGPQGERGATGATGAPGKPGTCIDAIRVEDNMLVYEVTDESTGEKRTLCAKLPV